MSKHIYFVCSALHGGGAERVAVNLAGYFASHGYEFTFVPVRHRDIAYPVPEGVDVDYSILDRHMSPLRRIMTVRKFMKSNRSAVFMSFLPMDNVYLLLSALHLDVLTVISIRNFPFYDFDGLRLKKLFLALRNVLYKTANLIVCQTEAQKEYLARFGIVSETCIPNPVMEELPDQLPVAKSGKIVAVGRLEPQKNYSMMLKAFKIIVGKDSNVKLHIFGQGSLEASLADLACDLGVDSNVVFEGYVSDVPDSIRDAACFVMTSSFEGQSNALIEAIAMGVPCVVTDSEGGAAGNLIRSGVNGFTVANDDVSDFALKVLQVLGNDSMKEKALSYSDELRRNLSLAVVGKSWIDAIERSFS